MFTPIALKCNVEELFKYLTILKLNAQNATVYQSENKIFMATA